MALSYAFDQVMMHVQKNLQAFTRLLKVWHVIDGRMEKGVQPNNVYSDVK